MLSFAILVPVLGRADRLLPLVTSIREAAMVPWHLRFLCSPDDEPAGEVCHLLAAEHHEISVREVPWSPGHGDWAKKINLGYRETSEELLLLGATDLRFHRGWDLAVLRVLEETGAGVIGTNDLGNPAVRAGRHATHPVVARGYADEYGTIDEPAKVLHEGYQHQWVDTELVQTAIARDEWAFAEDAIVEHLHPFWGKGEMDETYEKALSTPRADQRLYAKRARLWKARPARRSPSSARRSGRAAAS